MSLRLPLAALAVSLAMVVGADAATRKPQQQGQGEVQGDQAKIQPGKEKQFPTGSQWTLVNMGSRTADPASRPTLQLDTQFRIKGFAGCNTFSATAYPQSRQGFAVSAIAQTRKACEPGVMAFERDFLIALRTASFWDLENGFLVIKGARGELKFDRAL